MIRLLTLSAILSLIGLFILQLLHAERQPVHPPPTQQVDWFGNGVVFSEMSAQGQLKQKIIADQLIHYTPQEVTDLFNPKIEVFPDGEIKDHWLLRADKGRLFHGERRQDITRIDLWHHVALSREASATQVPVTLETSSIVIFPEKEYAHTDQYTLIKQPGHQMSGDGMEVFFDTQQFRLINNVSSVHESTD